MSDLLSALAVAVVLLLTAHAANRQRRSRRPPGQLTNPPQQHIFTAHPARSHLPAPALEEQWLGEQLQRILGRQYRVCEVIGLGAFGVVYAVADSTLGRELAVKVLRYPMPDLLLRFDREAKILAKLRHPAIVPVFFVGEGDGLHYIVMPRLQGTSLRGILNEAHTLELGETVRIGTEAAAALDEAHSVGVIHRDVKPENIFLEGPRRRVQVMDFGVAKLLEPSGFTAPSFVLGTIIGTAEYMSPEQWTGDPAIDGRSDVYSLACVVFEMLVGRPPFTGATPHEISHKHLTERPPSLRALQSQLPSALESIVHQALAKSPSDRFRTASQFAEALSNAA